MPDRSPANSAGRPFVSKQSVVTGGEEAAELALANARKGVDVIDSVIFFAKEGALPVDVTAEASVPADGKLAVSETDTSEGALLVFWRRKQP